MLFAERGKQARLLRRMMGSAWVMCLTDAHGISSCGSSGELDKAILELWSEQEEDFQCPEGELRGSEGLEWRAVETGVWKSPSSAG
jgi:hypothetical protein